MNNLFKILFADIIRGYSTTHKEKQTIYVKHFGHLDVADFCKIYEDSLAKAIKNNILVLKDREEQVYKTKDWTREQTQKINELKQYLDGLFKSKTKTLIPDQLNYFDTEIKKITKEHDELSRQKKEIIGFTAEDYANSISNSYYIFLSLYKDNLLKEPLYEHSLFDELDPSEINRLMSLYNEASVNFNTADFKKLALQDFFINTFFLCNDDVLQFYGKPAIGLTLYQIELFNFGRYFKNIISEHGSKIDQSLFDDPDQLIEWHSASKQAQELMGKTKLADRDNVVTGIVGLKRDGMKNLDLGENTNTINFSQMTKKYGGKVNFEEYIKETT